MKNNLSKEQKKVLNKIVNNPDLKRYKDVVMQIVCISFLNKINDFKQKNNILIDLKDNDYLHLFKTYLLNFNEFLASGINVLDIDRKQFFNVEESYFMEEE